MYQRSLSLNTSYSESHVVVTCYVVVVTCYVVVVTCYVVVVERSFVVADTSQTHLLVRESFWRTFTS